MINIYTYTAHGSGKETQPTSKLISISVVLY